MVLQVPTLLITDDDSDYRETLSGLFEQRGYLTRQARDGEEALAILRAHPVHVALLDMHMPRLTGLETIRRARQFLNLPCILLSAALDEALARQALQAQAYAVRPKPIGAAELLGLVTRAMRQMYDWPPG